MDYIWITVAVFLVSTAGAATGETNAKFSRFLTDYNKVDHCSRNPCQHGGTCENHHSHTECRCTDAYTGIFCETLKDHCASHPCQHGGTCHNEKSYHLLSGSEYSYRCDCQAGWMGHSCEIVDPCSNNPCQNSGTCHHSFHHPHGYYCACATGYVGDYCETDVSALSDPCRNQPCKNGGECKSTGGSYVCTCTANWSGTRCDKDIDECTMYHICQNSATCLNLPGTFHCTCATGFSGVQCAHGQPTTCSRTCILRSLAFQNSVKSANATTCPNSSSFGSNEALPMQCCQTQTSSTWIKGQHVMTQCNSGTMTPYTTVAIFRSDGSVEPNTAGILTECLSGGAGFSIVRQDCASFPTVIHVNGTAVGQVDNKPDHYSIVL
ncbi:fibropellin-1-like isoform X2 [Ruditapes philippinarum]|uniref:fibropellin-1-like isoform X2 n=1 Tax=Ruditapes philippinarum TaxID=129788 RepID=UPI00295BBFF0|nr:fibropellin-1-like isoform X2 [Ruditapes philippinarum]